MALSTLGPRLRLRDLQPQDLPTHPDLAALQQSASPIAPNVFAEQILEEARTFATEDWSRNFKTKSDTKSSPPATAPVELVVREVNATEVPESVRSTHSGVVETWFGRVSNHENQAKSGTAEWAEFEQVLLDNHSENEGKYTPEIYDTHRVLRWDPSELHGVPGWTKVEMSVWEMCHNLPAPLNKRLFTVLVVSALADSATAPSFITVQVPVNLKNVPSALYATGRNKTEGKTADQRKDTVAGIYVSVERAELAEEGKKVRWQMATASDAKGNLPMWAQKMGVPGAVVKDVGLVVGYIEKLRQSKA